MREVSAPLATALTLTIVNSLELPALGQRQDTYV